MQINNVQFSVELIDILLELKIQLENNGIYLLQKMKDSGDDIMVSCPYHGGGVEKHPSAGIRKDDGQFHCFACNEIHSLQEVISFCFGHYDDLLGAFGWKWLLNNFAVSERYSRKDIDLDFSRKSRSENKIQYVSEDELDSYRYIHPYMFKRKLTYPIIELFDIGFDKKTQCLTFPVRDKDGRCLFVARRSVNIKYFSYPKGAEKPLYGIYELCQVESFPDEIIVCESMLDCLSCWVWGKYAVALNGLGNELSIKQLNELPCRKIILATDNDERGQAAREKLRKQIKNKIITEYILPDGKKDINDLTEKEFENLQEIF